MLIRRTIIKAFNWKYLDRSIELFFRHLIAEQESVWGGKKSAQCDSFSTKNNFAHMFYNFQDSI